MSVSDIPYPGNALAQPRPLASDIEGLRVWWCALDDDAATASALAAWLSAAEHARAARFSNAALARRYIAGRAALRWVLGGELGVPPEQVRIERGVRGRPQLQASDALDFNVSNTRSVALVAVCSIAGTRVGVDVEHAERVLRHTALARKFLTPREHASIASDDPDWQRRAFLRLWTCKEAMSKATGDALSAPLRDLDVQLDPALALADGPAPYTPADWRLAAIDAPDGYLATAALWRSRSPQPGTHILTSRAVLDTSPDSR